MAILYVGIDLAKNVFAVHGVNEHGKVELVRPAVARAKLHELVASLPPCTIGMEACSGAHHWARLFGALGHTVRLIAPKFVTPYRLSGKRGKNDAADAAAICEAVQRPHMRFVPAKTEQQQSQLMVHRARQGFVEQRTATINRIRGLLGEFGVVLPLKAEVVRREAGRHLEDLPGWGNTVIGDLLSEVHRLDERIAQYDAHLRAIARQSTPARSLMRLNGIGETTATAIVAMVGNGHEFASGRQFAAWLGLVPGQYSSGGKARLGRITKAGDAYLRGLLVMGARAPCCRRRRTRPIRSAVGPSNSPNGAATGAPWWPSRRRTRAWPGRCSPGARRSRCQREREPRAMKPDRHATHPPRPFPPAGRGAPTTSISGSATRWPRAALSPH